MEICMEEASEFDLPSVLNLYRNALDIDKPIISVENANYIFKKMNQYPDYRLYIAKMSNEIVGSFALLIMDNLAHFGTPSAIIEDVVVAEKHQNNGIGKKMMEFSMEKARAKGCYKMVLSSNIKREKAHQFYENLGFVKHGYSFMVEL